MASSVIVVTGAAGMIGFSVATALASDRRGVIGTDVAAPAETPSFPFEAADIRDFDRLQRIAGTAVDAVVHCGAISGPMLGRDRPKDLADINIGGTLNMLEIARRTKARRVVYTSTCMAYGHTPEGLSPVDETAPLRATDIYGASKAAGEQMANAFVHSNGVDAVSLRLCWVYGPRRRTDCLVNKLIRDGRAGQATRLPFGGGYHRQFVYIDDVVEAILVALDARKPPRRVYNVTGGQRLTFDAIAEVVGQVAGPVKTEFAPGPDPQDYRQERFAIDAVAEDLGWRPRHDLRAGVKAYAAWLESHEY
jgi:nucleoside-diphosphate-sugar epimerase